MYADAAVFVFALWSDERLPNVAASKRFVQSVVRGDRRIATSVLTWDEVVYTVRRLHGPEDSADKAEDLLSLPNVAWVPVDLSLIRRASVLYRALPILPRDAIHAACAIEAGEQEVVSEDRVFDRVPGITRVWPPP